MKRPALLAACAAALALATGCASDPREGYSFSSTHRGDVQTVNVPVFENYTFSQGLEVQLTEAVIKELQRSTGMRVTSNKDADTLLSAIITRAEIKRLSVDSSTGLVQEAAYQISVDFDWKDNRTGKVLVSRRSFVATDTFVPAKTSSERLEVGQYGAVQRLARDLVAEIRSTW